MGDVDWFQAFSGVDVRVGLHSFLRSNLHALGPQEQEGAFD